MSCNPRTLSFSIYSVLLVRIIYEDVKSIPLLTGNVQACKDR